MNTESIPIENEKIKIGMLSQGEKNAPYGRIFLEEGLTMCDVLDKFFEQGVKQGIEQGEKIKAKEMLAAVKATGKMTDEELAKIAVYFTIDDIQKCSVI